MTFEERLVKMAGEVEVPDELSPENIALMLKKNCGTAQSDSRNIKMTAGGAEKKNISAKTVKNKRKYIAIRSFACAAACAALVTGVWLYRDGNDADQVVLGDPISYADVKQPETYGDLYGYIRDIYLNGSSENAAFSKADGSAPDASDHADDVSEADIICSSGNRIFYIRNDTLYVFNTENGVSELTEKLQQDDMTPVEMFVDGDKLVLVSIGDMLVTETSSSPVPCVTADVYNIGADTLDKASTFTQAGSYMSSTMVDGSVYLVTSYVKYQHSPLENETDLDNFVPVYFVNGEKSHVAAEDIIIPSNANSTDYTVISGINCRSGNAEAKVSAVLGTPDYVYSSADRLYVAGVGFKNSEYTVVTSFALTNGAPVYRANGAVEGAIITSGGMGSRDNSLMLAAETTDAKTKEVSSAIYILNDDMVVSGSAGKLLPGKKISNVRFADGCAALYTDSTEPALTVDLTNEAEPVQSDKTLLPADYVKYSAARSLGVQTVTNEDGTVSMKLTMADTSTNSVINELTTESFPDLLSEAFTDKKAILADSENRIIGIPLYSHNEFGTRSIYAVWTYDDEAGFIFKGQIEYADLDDSTVFRRAAVNGDVLYAIGNGRIVSAELEDLKVIDTLEF